MAIKETNFHFKGQTGFYRGKVRDVYEVGELFIVVATDRISAFDHVLPRPIPYKGQVLNQLAAYFLKATKDIVPNWLVDCPDPNVGIGFKCRPIEIEMVIRGYLAGHAWRLYEAGKREICGVRMPDNMKQNDPFPTPIITPATKAREGHDEDISRTDILRREIVSASVLEQLESYTRQLFERGQEMAGSRGLILVDTKYEFGLRDDCIYLIDEIHTADSSRYFYADGYEERQDKGVSQEQLSKEFVREWLMANDFQGLKGQKMPEMPDGMVEKVTDRYIHLYETLTGSEFISRDYDQVSYNIFKRIQGYLNTRPGSATT